MRVQRHVDGGVPSVRGGGGTGALCLGLHGGVFVLERQDAVVPLPQPLSEGDHYVPLLQQQRLVPGHLRQAGQQLMGDFAASCTHAAISVPEAAILRDGNRMSRIRS